MNFLRFSREKLIVALLLVQVFFIQWLNVTKYYSIFLDVVIFCFLFTRKINPKFLYSILLFIFYLVINSITTQFRLRIFLFNTRHILVSILIIISIGIIGSQTSKAKRILTDFFYIINGYMVLNVFVLILELNGFLFLAGRHETENTFVPDLICGLFGYNGTQMLGMFSCFFLLYDLWYYRTILSSKKKKSFMVYYIIMLGFLLYISVPNDNKSFYFILLYTYGLYFISCQNNRQKRKEKRKEIRVVFFITLIGMLLFLTLYFSYFPFKRKIDLSMQIFINAISGKFITGSSERFMMIDYFFRNNNINKLLGEGYSSMRWNEKMGFGFLHFGQNDMGPFLLLGGLGFVFSMLTVVYCVLGTINKSNILTIFELLFLIGCMILYPALTLPSITISYMLLILVCALENNKRRKMEN